MHKVISIIRFFWIPSMVMVGIFVNVFFTYGLHLLWLANVIAVVVVALGSLDLIRDTATSVWHRQFALDYIALLAIITALVTQQYLVAAIITLMLSGGNTLEEYATTLAKKSLTNLANRIPHEVNLWRESLISGTQTIETVIVGQEIAVRKGEVVPLDGELISEEADIDESSLTGEPYPVEKIAGETVRSGTVNVGNILILKVTKADQDSTYRKIITMVQQAQDEKSPLIRMADRYSAFFTIVTLGLCGFAYFLSHDLQRVLAVLVIATPCPLILATPIAMIGGVNSAAHKKIIIKRLASLEVLAKVQALIFDKTGTLTFGKPVLKKLDIHDKKLSEKEVLSIAAAIERNSLHPLAKAIVWAGRERHIEKHIAHQVNEEVGKGISGEVGGQKYTLKKAEDESLTIQMWQGKKLMAEFAFEDQLKPDSVATMRKLQERGLRLLLFTGDKLERAQQAVAALGLKMEIKAETSPEQKKNGVQDLKRQGLVTAMIGDGINDAPALASSDVGMVFSNQEQTASSEAADIVFLHGNLEAVTTSIQISQRTTRIALESILVGIGLSIFGMSLASFGLIVPVVGAFVQEAIDIGVILNALRASRTGA